MQAPDTITQETGVRVSCPVCVVCCERRRRQEGTSAAAIVHVGMEACFSVVVGISLQSLCSRSRVRPLLCVIAPRSVNLYARTTTRDRLGNRVSLVADVRCPIDCVWWRGKQRVRESLGRLVQLHWSRDRGLSFLPCSKVIEVLRVSLFLCVCRPSAHRHMRREGDKCKSIQGSLSDLSADGEGGEKMHVIRLQGAGPEERHIVPLITRRATWKACSLPHNPVYPPLLVPPFVCVAFASPCCRCHCCRRRRLPQGLDLFLQRN